MIFQTYMLNILAVTTFLFRPNFFS